MEYKHSFEKRTKSFLNAVNRYEHCMEYEFKSVIEELYLEEEDIVLNLGGGGLNINKYFSKNIRYIPIDFSEEFSKLCNIPYTKHNKLPFLDKSIDKIIILAVLHHFTNDERIELYKECKRILKDKGKFIVADVIKDSVQDIWLNKIVNKYNPFGHKGNFFTEESLIEGFNRELKIKEYTWWFNNYSEMLIYIKELFYLEITYIELQKELNEVLKPYKKDNKYYFDWKLIYFICKKN